MLFVSDQSDTALRGTTTVTILLCPEILSHLQNNAAAFGTSRGIILRNLVRRFGIAAARGPRSRSVRTQYQAARQNLARYNFKIETDTWARIQVIARGLGVSACVVVDRLLRMDAELSSAPGGDPTAGGKPIAARRNLRVLLRVCWEIEMTQNSMSRKIHLGQYVRDRSIARKAAAVRAHQKAWCRDAALKAQKKPGF